LRHNFIMPSSYSVQYFDGRGRGESIRLMLAQCGVAFKDNRIKDTDDYEALKKDQPLGQWPVLTVDGKKLGQTNAILRFLARQYHLAGETPFDDAIVDMLGDQVQDGYVAMYKDFKDEATFQSNFRQTAIPYLTETSGPNFEKILKSNKSGYLVGDKLTWADIHAAEYFNKFILHADEHTLDPFPAVKAHNEKVFNEPKIKAYIKTRPDSKW